MTSARGPAPSSRATVVIAVLLGIGALYVARPALIPLGLAMLIAFVLSPVLGPLERRVGRVPAVALVAIVTVSLLGALAWGVGRQVDELARELPKHRERLSRRIGELRRTTRPPAVEQLHGIADEVLAALSSAENERNRGTSPVAVVVQAPSTRDWLSPANVAPWVVGAALTALLAVFMLLERQELRNRVIRLAGFARLPIATRALDEASRRIASYLMTQIAVNAALGAAVAIGLALIGIPYALVWGLLTALLRFVPFIGFWASLSVVVAVALSVSDDWTQPMLVIALFAGLGAVLMVGVEPHLYSRSAGVSRVALLTAVTTLGWLWGPAGLLLATPITVCLVVLGRHVPDLKPIALVLGAAPALPPHATYYQRLLAGDTDEAAEVVESFLEGHAVELLLDSVVLPALSSLKRDRLRGALTEEDEERVLLATRRIIADLTVDEPSSALPEQSPVVVGMSLDNPIGQLALELFARSFGEAGCRFTIRPSELLSGEVLAAIERDRPGIVCVGAVPPGGVAEVRQLTKRLRARLPDLIVLIGRWGGEGYTEEATPTLLAAGAHAVGTTLAESRRQLSPLLQIRMPGAEVSPSAS